MSRLLTAAVVALVMCLGTAAQAQTGGTGGLGGTGGTGGTGGLTGGGTGGSGAGGLNLPGLSGLQGNLDNSSTFTDDRRVTGQSAGSDTVPGGGGGGGGGGLGSIFSGGAGGGGGIFGQLFGGGGGGLSTTGGRRTLRAPMRAEFDVIRPTETAIAANLQGRLVNISPLTDVAGSIRVEVVDRVATLHGSVDSARQKDLAERMARLEPGISEVRNELIILP